jgi:hypothetical protein
LRILLFFDTTVRPTDFRAYLRGLGAEQLHHVAVSGPPADRTLARTEIADRKVHKRYQLPAIDSMRIFDFLVLTAYQEHPSGNQSMKDLVALRDEARRGVFVGALYQKAARLLHGLYAPLGSVVAAAHAETPRAPDA